MKFTVIACFLSVTSLMFYPTCSVVAQSTADDSALYKKAVDNYIALYQQTSGDQSGLYNGSQYGGYPFLFTEGHPFFINDFHGRGNIQYDGILYENILMQFDEVQDALVMDSSSRRIQLLNERVTRFTLFGNNFIRIVRDTESTVLVRTGFYNLLYEGKVSLLKKQEKLIRDDVSTGVVQHFLDTHDYYYIKRSDGYHSINSKGNLFSLFKDRKKDIKQYIRKNKLSYRKDRDNMLAKVTAYYDQLIN